MCIQVLWFDDEFDSDALKSTFIRMEKHFKLIKCNSKDEFLDKIEKEKWDAIVLDVLDANGRDSGFQTAVRTILSDYKDEPWFVFSGQENVINKESDIQSMLNEKNCHRDYADIIYVKSEDNDKLIEDIISAVSNKAEWKTRNEVRGKYSKALSSFYSIINSNKEPLFDILMAIEGHKEIDHKVYYTQLRIVLEEIFRNANKLGLLHDKCLSSNGKLNLTESCLFLSGKKTRYIGVYSDIAHFPKIIADNVKNLLVMTGGASHTSEPEKSGLTDLQSYWAQINTPYLLYSLTFMLLDIIIWYKDYSDNNNNIEENKSHWKTIHQNEVLTGRITNFNLKGYAYLKPNGSGYNSENCRINPECCNCRDIQIDDVLTVEYITKKNSLGNDIRIATKIIGKEN